jgi:aminopeptidase YwaD
MLRRSLVIALLGLLGLGIAHAAGEAAATITGGEIREHITYLASDELQGRDTGSAGERAAGEYLAAAFARYGLEPMGEDGSYFLPFPVAGEASVKRATVRMERGAFYRDFELGRDFQPFGFSGSGELDVPVVFAGYGITDPQRGYDDYAGLDVRGKAVLILRHEPREKDGQASAHAHFTTKAINAREHGAVALLIATDPLNHADDESLVPFGMGGGDDLGVIALHVRQSLARGLVRLAGKDLTEVQKKLDEALAPDSFELGARLRVSVEVERQTITARNVVGRLPGSDPALRDEVVVIGAHYDHVGLGAHGGLDPRAEGQIHNGADDNASGTSGMLELAQAFAGAERPRRTIIFMGFSGEERGLLGSEHFVKHPAVPLTSIVAMINLDMIGRLREGSLEVGGVGTSPGFRELVEAAVAPQGLKASLDPSGYGPSDHASFYAAKVPVLFFFTGLHDDYHRPGDDTPKIEFDGAARVARAAFFCAERLANADARPAYVEVAPQGRGGNRPRLGVQLDQARTSGGAGISQVVDGSPAANAGLLAGDVIVRLGDEDIDTARDLVEALGGHQFDDKVQVVVLRGTERVTVEVTLTRQP